MLNYDNITITEATAIQNELRHKVSLITELNGLTTIAGGDVSYNKYSDVVYAAIVVLSYPEMELLSYTLTETKTKFPYVPNYLAFREVPALLEAWEQLPIKPDVMVLDGQGIVHPREYGIACHFGVLTGNPSVGCGKNMLYGSCAMPEPEQYNTSPIITKAGVKGYALRTKKNVKPVYVSPGHKISIEDSVDILKNCVLKHRIPEPTRLAHDIVNLFRTGKLQAGYHVTEHQQNLL